jgi:hypothetical protein
MRNDEVLSLQKRLQKYANQSHLLIEEEVDWVVCRNMMRVSKKITSLSLVGILLCIVAIGTREFLKPESSAYAALPSGDVVQIRVN